MSSPWLIALLTTAATAASAQPSEEVGDVVLYEPADDDEVQFEIEEVPLPQREANVRLEGPAPGPEGILGQVIELGDDPIPTEEPDEPDELWVAPQAPLPVLPGSGASRLAAPGVGEVELTGAQWRRLQPTPEPEDPGPMVLRREVRLTRVEGGVLLRARYWVQHGDDDFFAAHVAGPTAELRRLRWNGRDVTIWPSPQGPLVVERMKKDSILDIEAFVAGNPGSEQSLRLLEAPRGTVTLEGFAEHIVLSGDERPVVRHEGAWSTGAGDLKLAPRSPEPRDRGPLAVASVGLGVTVGDAEVRGRARLRWEIRQGTRSAVSFTVRGVGEDLSVEGPLVGRWERTGDRVQVELSGPTQGRVDLDLRWSIATPRGAEASVPMPMVEPDEVFRSVAAVQVARDGEVDVKPQLTRPWRPIPRVRLPDYADGLIEGTPTAAFVRPRTGSGGDALQLLRLEPVPGPPMVVDVADVQLAITEQGRSFMRARYEVRNERASHLSVTPPPGLRLVGVEVGGRPVTPAIDGDAIRIPLKRSIETVQGMLTVPVTLVLLGEGDAWERKEQREVPLPAVDAPVNVVRTTVHLPRHYRNRVPVGEHDVVDDFSEGQGVGYGLYDDGSIARADRLFARAIDAWNDNDFEGTQDQLDELRGLGAYGSNPDGLQANVDLVMPMPRNGAPDESAPPARVAIIDPVDLEAMRSGDDEVTVYDFEDDDIDGEMFSPQGSSISTRSSGGATARRIRARLRARSGKKKAQYDRRKRKAKSLKDEGRYDEAAAEYRRAIEDSRDLDALEDEESVEYEYEAAELAGELEAVEEASGGQSEVSKLVTEDAELDLVGGLFVVLRASEDPPDDDTLAAPDDGPLDTAALPSVPKVGVGVQYQQLLLEAGEQRTVRIDARRLSRWRAARAARRSSY